MADFDAIIIGSDLGGLTAGAVYGQAGRHVLLLERNEYFGGAATVYRHNGLAIETSLHEIDGLDENDPKLPLLRSLGLDQDLTFIDVGEFYEVPSPLLGAPFVMPRWHRGRAGRTAVRFPQHAASIDIYFDRLVSAGQGIRFAARHHARSTTKPPSK